MKEKFQHKPDSGSLFKNDKKETDNHPDYRGDGLINGKEVWISAWLNDGKKGKYLKLSFQDKESTHEKGKEQAQASIDTPSQEYIQDDSIPF